MRCQVYSKLLFIIPIIMVLLIPSSCRQKDSTANISTSDTTQEVMLQDKSTPYQDESLNPHTNSSVNVSEIFQAQESLIARINSKDSYEKLITKTFDINDFVQKYYYIPYISYTGERPNIKQINDEYGIECIRRNSTGSLYSVHKVAQGGLLYIFYNTRTADNNKYEEVHNWFYVVKTLKYEDFAAIKEGANIDDVIALDAATIIFKNRMNAHKSADNSGSFSTHYLQDGILTIFYVFKDGTYTVGWQRYEKDFQVDIYGYALSYPYDGHILPIDILENT